MDQLHILFCVLNQKVENPLNSIMKSFRKYLSEIFRQQGTYSIKQEKHPDLKHDSDEEVTYAFTPTNTRGEPDFKRKVRTTFMKTGKNTWEAMFTVGGSTHYDPGEDFPSHVTKKVFDHVKHFVDTTTELAGKAPNIEYQTSHPKKERIYQAVAKRLGVRAENTGGYLDPEYDTRRNRRKHHEEEPI